MATVPVPEHLQGQKCLKVETPITSDGLNLVLGDDDKIQYDVQYLPLSAKPELERSNNMLPSNLKHKITVVDPAAKETKAKDNAK